MQLKKNVFTYVCYVLFAMFVITAIAGYFGLFGEFNNSGWEYSSIFIISVVTFLIIWFTTKIIASVKYKSDIAFDINEYDSVSSKGRIIIIILFSIAVAIRLFLVFSTNDSISYNIENQDIFKIATDFANIAGLDSEYNSYEYLALFPSKAAYIMLLGYIFKFIGATSMSVIILNIVLSSISILFVYLISKNFAGRITSIIALIIAGFIPSRVYICLTLSSSILYEVLFLGIILLITIYFKKIKSSNISSAGKYIGIATIGVATGLLGFVSSFSFIFALCVFLTLLFKMWKEAILFLLLTVVSFQGASIGLSYFYGYSLPVYVQESGYDCMINVCDADSYTYDSISKALDTIESGVSPASIQRDSLSTATKFMTDNTNKAIRNIWNNLQLSLNDDIMYNNYIFENVDNEFGSLINNIDEWINIFCFLLSLIAVVYMFLQDRNSMQIYMLYVVFASIVAIICGSLSYESIQLRTCLIILSAFSIQRLYYYHVQKRLKYFRNEIEERNNVNEKLRELSVKTSDTPEKQKVNESQDVNKDIAAVDPFAVPREYDDFNEKEPSEDMFKIPGFSGDPFAVDRYPGDPFAVKNNLNLNDKADDSTTSIKSNEDTLVFEEPIFEDPEIEDSAIEESVLDNQLFDKLEPEKTEFNENVSNLPVMDELNVEESMIEEPAVEESKNYEPEIIEPEIIEPEIIEPENIEPEIIESEFNEPENIELENIEPEIIEPEIIEPEIIEPEFNEPEFNEPEFNEPEIIEPEFNEPEIIEPEFNEPDIIEPEFIEPEINEPKIEELSIDNYDNEKPIITEPDIKELYVDELGVNDIENVISDDLQFIEPDLEINNTIEPILEESDIASTNESVNIIEKDKQEESAEEEPEEEEHYRRSFTQRSEAFELTYLDSLYERSKWKFNKKNNDESDNEDNSKNIETDNNTESVPEADVCNESDTENIIGVEDIDTEDIIGLEDIDTENIIGMEDIDTENIIGVEDIDTEDIIGLEDIDTEVIIGLEDIDTENIIGVGDIDTENIIGLEDINVENDADNIDKLDLINLCEPITNTEKENIKTPDEDFNIFNVLPVSKGVVSFESQQQEHDYIIKKHNDFETDTNKISNEESVWMNRKMRAQSRLNKKHNTNDKNTNN